VVWCGVFAYRVECKFSVEDGILDIGGEIEYSGTYSHGLKAPGKRIVMILVKLTLCDSATQESTILHCTVQ
jgi:hypothetical protein